MTGITETEVNAAQQAWCDALVRISAVHAEGGDFRSVASMRCWQASWSQRG